MTKEKCIRQLADPVQISECRQQIAAFGDIFDKYAQVLSLAGNTARLKILYLLMIEKSLCPCDLSDILGMSVPAVSQHLRKLKDAGLVTTRKTGQTIFYSLSGNYQEILSPVLQHLEALKPVNPA